jgi:hypothetical protein
VRNFDWLPFTPPPLVTFSGPSEVNTQIRGFLAYGADLIFSSGLNPLRELVDNPWVSLLELTFICLCQFLFVNAYSFLCMILGMRAAPRGGHLT